MLKDYYKSIPGFFDFEDIYNEAVALAPEGSTLVEVGTLFGTSAFYLAQKIIESGKDLTLACVDKWVEWPDVIFNPGTHYRHVIDSHGSLWKAFKYNLEYSEDLSNVMDIYRGDSVDIATQQFGEHNDHPFFVFIDADHTYEGCKRDILAWLPLITIPGIIAGHDYDPKGWPGVVQTVNEAFGSRVEVRNKSWLVRL